MKYIGILALLFSVLNTALAAEPILASGRWVHKNGSYQATWPGGVLSAQFTGQRIGIALNDERSYYAVEVDGQFLLNIAPAAGKRVIWLKNLTATRHRIDLIRRNETPDYIGQVEGFVLAEGGQWLPAPAAKKRKIEFIGDSFTAALAGLSTQRECKDADLAENTDIRQGFAVNVARELDAEWQINAMSGMGLVRNWNGHLPDRDFRTFYPRTIQSDATSVVTTTDWQPQMVVIALGLNDFSTPINSTEKRNAEQLAADYQLAYQALITEINAKYQQPQIVLMSYKVWPDDQLRVQVPAVVAAAKAAGLKNVHYLAVNPLQLTACQWHPNLQDHQQIAQQLLVKIREIKPLWFTATQ